jgi:hypothetical protein
MALPKKLIFLSIPVELFAYALETVFGLSVQTL